MIDGISASSNLWASSVMGVQAGTNSINSGASAIASITADSSSLSLTNLTRGLTQQNEGLYQVKASAKGIEIANKTLDSLFEAIA